MRPIVRLDGVVRVRSEEVRCGGSGAGHALIRVRRADGTVQAFFIDFDETQSNIRRVSARLATLAAVLNWLLPPGYAHRQGDIGIYCRTGLPAAAREISLESQPAEFAPLLGRRHRFDPIRECRFHRTVTRYFVQVLS